MSRTASGVGRYFASGSSSWRPPAVRELTEYGGARLFRGKRVLDLGTGDGRLALGAARWAREVVAVDPDPAAIRDARASARRAGARNVRFAVAPAQELPFRAGSFDVVILSWVL